MKIKMGGHYRAKGQVLRQWFNELYDSPLNIESLKKLIGITCNTIEINTGEEPNKKGKFYLRIQFYSNSIVLPRVCYYDSISCLILPERILLIHQKDERYVIVIKLFKQQEFIHY
jgi:hypothetical protein